MGRILSVGFELAGSIANGAGGMEHNGASGASALSFDTTIKRSGTYSLKVNGLSTGVSSTLQYQYNSAATTGPYYARTYFYLTTAPSIETRFLVLLAGSPSAYLQLTSTGAISLYDTTGLIGTTSDLSTSTWYRLELEYDASQAAGSDIIRLYIDGTLAVGSTTRSLTGAPQFLHVGGNIGAEANTTGTWYFDDMAVNDTSGSVQNGLPGEGSIVHLWPDDDGDADTTVTRSSGATTPTGTDRGANWQQLGAAFDKPTPNDATDFLLLTGNTSEVLVACESASTGGIGASDTITLVQVGGRIAAVTASTANWIPRVMSQSAGTKLAGSTVTIAVTAWQTHDDTAASRQYKLTSYTDPQAGGPWTPALLDTMQIGAATTDGNPDTLVTALWALVDYVPFVAGAGQPTIKRWGGVPGMRLGGPTFGHGGIW